MISSRIRLKPEQFSFWCFEQ